MQNSKIKDGDRS